MKIAKRTLYHPFTHLPLVQYLRLKVYCPSTWFMGYQCLKGQFILCIIPGVAIQFYWY